MTTPDQAYPILAKYGLETMAGDPLEVLHRHLTNNHAATVGGYRLTLDRLIDRLVERSKAYHDNSNHRADYGPWEVCPHAWCEADRMMLKSRS